MNNKVFASFFVLVIIMLISTLTSARPSKQLSLSREKRQSDQRIAELETLLALQKYGRHRFRMDRKKGVGADGEHPPGYGIIDFRMLGRKKKSTRFSPGELESSLKGEVPQQLNLPSSYHPEHQLDSIEASVEESVFPDQLPVQQEHDDESRRKQEAAAALPFMYIEKK